MNSPIEDNDLLKYIETKVAVPCVNADGAFVDSWDMVLDDVKGWIEMQDARIYYVPGGIDQFFDDLKTYITDSFKPGKEYFSFDGE